MYYKEGVQGAEKSYRHKTSQVHHRFKGRLLLSRPYCLYFGKIEYKHIGLEARMH